MSPDTIWVVFEDELFVGLFYHQAHAQTFRDNRAAGLRKRGSQAKLFIREYRIAT